MKFEEVLPALRAGKRIQQESWGTLFFQKDSMQSTSILPSSVIAEDWVVLKEPFDHRKLKTGDELIYAPTPQTRPCRRMLYLCPVPNGHRDYFFVLVNGSTSPIYTCNSECEFID